MRKNKNKNLSKKTKLCDCKISNVGYRVIGEKRYELFLNREGELDYEYLGFIRYDGEYFCLDCDKTLTVQDIKKIKKYLVEIDKINGNYEES